MNNIVKPVFFILLSVILLMIFYLGLQWLGLIDSTRPTVIPIPVIKQEVVIKPFCNEKTLADKYQMFMRKNGSDGGFSNKI